MEKSLIVLPYRSAPGALNMALDEALFSKSMNDGNYYLRFYGWDKPCLTLGYFQKRLPARGVPYIRRLTGGGSVLHEADLTFSLCGPLQSPFEDSSAVYRITARMLAESFSSLGLGEGLMLMKATEPHEKFYQCFDVPAAEDILINGKKIYGGAIRKKRLSFLFQGTIAGEISRGREEAVIKAFLLNLKAFFPKIVHNRFPAGLLKKSQQLAEEKYSCDSWNFKDSRAALASGKNLPGENKNAGTQS